MRCQASDAFAVFLHLVHREPFLRQGSRGARLYTLQFFVLTWWRVRRYKFEIIFRFRNLYTDSQLPRKSIKKPVNTYHAHRERQRRRILDAAAKLFDDSGIDRVAMAEITQASGVQPSTMYQYFRNKDDIVWAILEELFQERSRLAQQSIKQAPNALARITALLESMADELKNHQEKVRFMAQFDALYARTWPAERLLKLEAQFIAQAFQFFRELIRDGIADGTLRPDLDPDLTMQAVINTAVGTQRRLASLGNKIELEYGRPIDRLFHESIRVLLLGMRAEAKTSTRLAPRKQKTEKTRTTKRSS